MVLTIPEQLKSIAPYIRRAEELDKDTTSNDYKIISFYCKKFALESAIKLKINTPEVNEFLNKLMVLLEKEKLSITTTKEQNAITCENFAHSVFNRADDEDRNSIPTKVTAKIYYSAITFFEILEQFGELDNEIKEKLKYSKWRTTEILNAIKEGRQPTPGGFTDSINNIIQDNASINVDSSINVIPNVQSSSLGSSMPITPTNSYNNPIIPTNSSPISLNNNYNNSSSNSSISGYINPYPTAPQLAPSPVITNRPPPNNNNDPRVKDAIEVCNFAIAALKYNDITLAKDRLNEALRRLNAM